MFGILIKFYKIILVLDLVYIFIVFNLNLSFLCVNVCKKKKCYFLGKKMNNYCLFELIIFCDVLIIF